ncbi:hypothetical protein C8J56DRAFT_899427 [Mycena floridula]|nr:hypothetical protein C8J56DRAFT_899427 [Mycena floridula]
MSATEPSSVWHSIRPWMPPPLSLSVKEITSVSTTFVLSARVSDLTESDPILASLGIGEDDLHDEEPDEEDDDDEGSSDSPESRKPSFVATALAGGLSVEVDSTPWRRVLIRVDEKSDEAVIIIYGLLPGRQYDIDLELVQGSHKSSTRKQVVTEVDVEQPNTESHPDSEATNVESGASDTATTTVSVSPGRAMPTTPPRVEPSPGFAPLTLEDRLNQLQHALALITTERDNLSVSLKTTRRDSQKADAALRSDIEGLKRATERSNAAEQRAKQKALALQEAARRAHITIKEMEKQVEELENTLPDLKSQREEKENVYVAVKTDADRTHAEKEAEEERERKRIETMKAELSSLTNKLERLNTKKEKLDAGIPELEEQLLAVQREIDSVADSYQHSSNDFLMAQEMDFSSRGDWTAADQAFLPFNGRTQNNSLPGPIGRPSPPHGQRNGTISATAATFHQPSWPGVARQGHNPRSSSVQHQPQILANPHRQSSLKSTGSSGSSSSSPAASPAMPPPSNSTLSSRAAPFEPGRPLARTTSSGLSTPSLHWTSAARASQNQTWTSIYDSSGRIT